MNSSDCKEEHGMELYISNSGQEPIYAQITRQIKAKILNGELQQGDALPSIRLLAKELRISVITTKRAYEDLEADGFITTMPGRGSFVAPQNPALHREESLKQMEEHLQHAMPRGAAALPKTKCAKPLTFCGRNHDG
jgi:GntR family transcriptional regulator